jgi:Predicted membrane protein (DUF2142)
VRTTPGPRIAAAVLLGVLLAQAAWIVAVPPFRGMDEFDHAFRAAGVASGQWRLDDEAAGGRGLLVDVPAELVTAARGQCEALPYIVPETCDGDGPGADGTVRATTSAANYVPAYYWVVGTAGEPFSGAGSLYAMRIASAVLCALVLSVAAWCLTTWVRGSWAFVGLLVGLSPTLVYTTTTVAPNGLEMAAGVCLWTALLGLGAGDPPDPGVVRRERLLLAAATVAVVLLAGLRALGPLWVLMILSCVVALRGPRAVLVVAARHRAEVVVAGLLAVATSVAVLAWSRGNVPVPDGALNGEIDTSWGEVVRWPAWILSSIGAFPYRDQPAPLVVHLLVLVVLVTLLVAAVLRGADRGRGAVVLAAGLCLVVPSVLVALTLEERGGVWQGRYLLPFMAGVMVLAGLVLDRVRWQTHPRDVRPQTLAVVLLAVAHVVSVVHVQLAELDRESAGPHTGWVHPPTVGTGALMAVAWVVLAAVAWSLRASDPGSSTEAVFDGAVEPTTGAST